MKRKTRSEAADATSTASTTKRQRRDRATNSSSTSREHSISFSEEVEVIPTSLRDMDVGDDQFTSTFDLPPISIDTELDIDATLDASAAEGTEF